MKTFRLLGLLAGLCGLLAGQRPPAGGGATKGMVTLPDGPGKEATQKVCGSTCHGPDTIGDSGRTRNQWSGVVNAMVARGAKATDAELVQIVEYLSKHFAPGMKPAAEAASAAAGTASNRPRRGVAGKGPGVLGGGPADAQVIDSAAADRGKTVYIAECITCHGNKARGGNVNLPPAQQGADLVRSLVVLHDRYGDEIGRFLAKGHPLQSGRPVSSLTAGQVEDLSHYMHRTVMHTLRGGPEMDIKNVLTGDPAAGKAYFNGTGRCSTCHSPSGDLAGIGKKYDPPTLQHKFLFPRSVGIARSSGGGSRPPGSKPVTVTVTQPDGAVTEGVLVHLDDFNVALRDAQGEYRSFAITPAVKVVKHDPLAAHVELLDQYTDKNMHDVVAYLESLK